MSYIPHEKAIHNVKIKALVSTLYVAIIASTIFAIVAYKIRSSNDEDLKRHISTSSLLISKYMARSLDSIHLTIKHIAQQIEYDWTRGIPPSGQIKPFLKRSNEDLYHVRSINVIGSDGYLITDTVQPHGYPIFLGDREYVKKNRENPDLGFFLSKPTMGRITGEWMVSASYRFNKLSGKFGGVVSAIMDPYSYLKLFQKQLSGNVNFAILDKKGLVYFHSKDFFTDKHISFGRYILDKSVLNRLDGKTFKKSLFPFEKKALQSLHNVPGHENFYVLTKMNDPMGGMMWNEQLLSLFILYISFVGGSYYYFYTIYKKELHETEAIRMQEDSENRFRILAENATDMISLHYLDGTFKYVSPSAYGLTGYTKNELINMKQLKFIKPAGLKEIAKKFKNILRKREVKRFRYQIIDKQGVLHWFESSARLVKTPHQERKYQIVVVSRNIDETVQFENDLKVANQKTQEALIEAQSANMAKSQFLATMSHELRTPLNAVIGFSEMISMGEMGDINEKYQEYAHHIQDSGNQLLKIICDILDLSKIQTGRIDLDKKPIDVQQLIGECCEMMIGHANESEIKLINKINKKCPKVIADEQAVKQMVTNLLSNAIKYTPSGGEIRLTQLSKGKKLKISVEDTGVGISQTELKKVLEPFTQIEQTRLHHQNGIGLGLPLVKALIELHEGKVDLESTINVGTKVTLTFPEKVIIN